MGWGLGFEFRAAGVAGLRVEGLRFRVEGLGTSNNQAA